MDLEEAIAIVGVGGRFPGADDLDEFWQILVNGENHVIDIPPDRWNNDAFYDEDKNVDGKLYIKKAGFLKNYDLWDNRVFGISDVEAEQIDPQQRHVLECVHMAMEDGGITRENLHGSQTGVYIGAMNDDYKMDTGKSHEKDTNYSLTGVSTSIISARVSYVYNLLGPCMSVDTACSSALVAIHLGCQAIKTGDCDQAICGGVNTILLPDLFVSLCKARMMSATSQCQAFADSADGYARGEGCGVVILKKYSKAIEDGNKIWAVISSGCNQDGRTMQPITAPSGIQQENLLRKVYAENKIDPASIQYIEAHGTGTPIGDPIETNSLGTFFSEHRSQRDGVPNQILIGSVKTNIGHLESAAGSAGLIKVLLMMKYGKFVPSLHVKEDCSNINPKIDFGKYGMAVSVRVQNWPLDNRSRRVACINSFGFGGTNAHAIIHQVIDHEGRSCKSPNMTNATVPKVVCISAADQESLKNCFQHLNREMKSSEYDLADIAYTSTCRRDHHLYRRAIVAFDGDEFIRNTSEQIEAIGNTKRVQADKPKIVYVYCGVGTTWTSMCQDFLRTIPTFVESVDKVDRLLSPMTGWSIHEKLLESSDFSDPLVNHLAIFVCQIALTDLLNHWGIQPDFVLGQSVGEVAAAYAARNLSIEEAVQLIYHRSRILAQQTGGSMMVVGQYDVKEIENLCDSTDGKVSIAVHISPKTCTISGDANSLCKIKEELGKVEKGPLMKELSVKCAYHSPYVHSCKPDLQQSFEFLSSNQPDTRTCLPQISTVTGTELPASEFHSKEYWTRNVCEPVLMMKAVKTASQKGGRTVYVEIGPSPILLAHIADIFHSHTPVCVPTMKRKDGLKAMFEFLGEMYQLNIGVDWNKIQSGRLVKIPKYHFNKRMHLYRNDGEILRLQGETHDSHSHQFVRRTPNKEDRFKVLVDKSSTGYVYDHKLSGTVLVPGSTYVETALEIAKRVLKEDINAVQVSAEFLMPLTPASGRKYELFAEVTQGNILTKEHRFTVLMNETHLIEGVFMKRTMLTRTPVDIASIKENLSIARTSDESYGCLERLGFTYGKALRLIGRSWSNEKEVLAELTVPEVIKQEVGKTNLHPAVLDGVFQIVGIFATLLKGWENYSGNNKGIAVLPKGVGNIVVNLPIQERMYGYAKEMMQTDKTSHYNIMLLSETGDVIAEIIDFNTKLVTPDDDTSKDIFYSLDWMEIQPNFSQEIRKTGKYILITGDSNVTNTLMSVLPDAEVQTCILKPSQEGLHACRESIKKTLATAKEDVGALEGIVFATGYKIDEVIAEELGVYETVTSTFLVFADLIKGMFLSRVKVPLYVLTEATQVVSGVTRGECNVLGSELWGCVHSLSRESDVDARLIDVHPRLEPSKSLQQFLTDSQELREYKEVVLANNRVFVSQFKFTKNPTVVPHFRSAFRDKSMDVVMMSNRTRSGGNDPFLAFHRDNEANEAYDPLQYECIETESVCLHTQGIYPTIVETSLSDFGVWKCYNQEPHEVLAVEIRGYRSVSSYTDIKSSKLRSQTNRLPVVVCYPTKAKSKIFVPKTCVVDANSLPLYIPGILTLCTVVWYLSQKVPRNSSVCLLQEGPPNALNLLLAVMLKSKRKIKLLTRNSLCLRNEEPTIPQTVILLSKLGPNLTEDLSESVTNVGLVVSLRQFLPIELERKILSKNSQVAIQSIDTMEVLRPSVLERIVQKAAVWLQNLDKDQLRALSFMNSAEKDIEEKRDKTDLFMLPMPTFPVLDEKGGRMKASVRETELFRKEACYVIIGGLSGLGWEIMNQLAEEGAGYLVTLSRRSPDEAIQLQIDGIMEEYGCRIICLKADITDIVSVQAAFNSIREQLPNVPIRGLFHGGAVLADSLLATMTDEQALKVLAPKVQGSWNLHLVTKDLYLDYFVMHSSIVSIIGNPGQTNYGAGNAFMDSLAYYRRSMGLSGICFNWGALDLGMAKSDPKIEETLKETGILTLTTDQIRNCFKHALMNDRPQNIFASFIWGNLGTDPSIEKQATKFRPVLSSTAKRSNRKIAERSGNRQHMDIQKYMASTEEEKLAMVLDVVYKTTEEVFVVGHDSLDENTQFVSLGADSMTAMSFVNIVFEVTSCRIPVVQLLSGDTSLLDIANYLLENITDASDVNLPEEVAEAFNRPITFMQDIVLEDMLKTPMNPTHRHLFDFEFFSFDVPTEYWEKVFCHLLKMHPQLRTVFQHGGGDINPVVTPPDEVSVDFEVVGIEELDKMTSDGEDLRSKYSFDLTKDLPVKFRLAKSADRTLVRIVSHKIVSDIIAANLIFRDIQRIGKCFMDAIDLPEEIYEMDYNAELKRSLQSSLPQLQEYWRDRMRTSFDPLTLGSDVNTPVDASYNYVIERDLTQQNSTAIFNYIEQNGLTLYQLMASMYQLLLHSLTGSITIPIVTSVDMRMHVPQLRNMITRCINRFPVISQIPEKGTVEEYIQQNTKQIQEDVSNNAYPYQLIKAEIPEDRRAHLQRHGVVMDNVKTLTTSVSEGRFRARIKNVIHANTNHETVLYVKYDLQEKSLAFEFGYNTAIIEKKRGLSILDQFMLMLEQFLVNPTSTLDDFVLTTQQPNFSNLKEQKSIAISQNGPLIPNGRRLSRQLPAAIRKASITSDLSREDAQSLEAIVNRRSSRQNSRRTSTSSKRSYGSYQATIEESEFSEIPKVKSCRKSTANPSQKTNGYSTQNGYPIKNYGQQNGYHHQTNGHMQHNWSLVRPEKKTKTGVESVCQKQNGYSIQHGSGQENGYYQPNGNRNTQQNGSLEEMDPGVIKTALKEQRMKC